MALASPSSGESELFLVHHVDHVNRHFDDVEAGHVFDVFGNDVLQLVEHVRCRLAVFQDDGKVHFGVVLVHHVGVDALLAVVAAQAFLDHGQDVALHVDDAVHLLRGQGGDLLHHVLVDGELVLRLGRLGAGVIVERQGFQRRGVDRLVGIVGGRGGRIGHGALSHGRSFR